MRSYGETQGIIKEPNGDSHCAYPSAHFTDVEDPTLSPTTLDSTVKFQPFSVTVADDLQATKHTDNLFPHKGWVVNELLRTKYLWKI